jgi:crossover junction endodeoxyribonuclease RuvC
VFVLGVDPGLSRCGYGAVGRAGNQLVAHTVGVIQTPADMALAQRLLMLEESLVAIVADVQPTAIAVERVFFQSNVRTAMAVGQASGLALLVAARAGIPVVEYTPSEVKMAVAGYGAADKAQMQAMVQALLRLPTLPEPPDAADALALAICHHAAGPLRASQSRAEAAAGSGGNTRGPSARLQQAIERAVAAQSAGPRRPRER